MTDTPHGKVACADAWSGLMVVASTAIFVFPTTGNKARPAGMFHVAQASKAAIERHGMPAVLDWARRNEVAALTWPDHLPAPNDWAAVQNFTADNPL